jgi:hypothetical protein
MDAISDLSKTKGCPKAGTVEEIHLMNLVNMATVAGLLVVLVGGPLVVALAMRRAMLSGLVGDRAKGQEHTSD